MRSTKWVLALAAIVMMGQAECPEEDFDGDGFTVAQGDCDDQDPLVNPDAEEICNGIDDNCDEQTDEGFPEILSWPDADGDGFGDNVDPTAFCFVPDGNVEIGGDCDDSDANINPGAEEACNGIDDDCDGVVDNGLDLIEIWVDEDLDGYGSADAEPLMACAPPAGYSDVDGDCNDADDSVNPGAAEVCNDIDDDCNGEVDDGLTFTDYWPDTDQDGYGNSSATPINTCGGPPPRHVPVDGDCDDRDPDVNPDTAEICNGTDDDCNGEVDDGLEFADWYPDIDRDGFGDAGAEAVTTCDGAPLGHVTDNTDCDDRDDSVFPGAEETCNGVDDDCNGEADDGLDFVDYYPDVDRDGFGDASVEPDTTCDGAPLGHVADNSDCDDRNDAVNPAATEVCNGSDDNCDGNIDEGLTFVDYWPDADQDGFGDAGADATSTCDGAPDGYVEDMSDCDDTNAAVNPAAEEVCNDIDDNCDGSVDEGLTFADYWPDADQDGFGDSGADATSTCDGAPDGYVEDMSDCDDTNAAVNPAADEVCNDVDDNCDGSIDEGLAFADSWPDADADGFGDEGAEAVSTCDGPPAGYVEDMSDCDDTSAAVNPAAEEVCNDGIDNNCDDEGCLLPSTITLADADATFLGEADGDNAGRLVASAGDVNGDGFDDVIVGAFLDDTAGADAGAAYVFYGPVSGSLDLSTADAKLVGEAAGDAAGFSAAGAGDINGDGFDDIIIGARGNDAGGANAGAAYVFYGPINGQMSLASADAIVRGGVGEAAGVSVNGAGDLNGDGMGDVVIGAYFNDSAANDAGAAYVFFGPLSGTLSTSAADATLTGETTNDRAGVSVGSAGDVNGDGQMDLLIGAYQEGPGGTQAGAAYVVTGPVSGVSSLGAATAKIVGEIQWDYVGWSVSALGDMNGDGNDDIVVAAPLMDLNGDASGAAFVFHGPMTGLLLAADAEATLLGAAAGDRAGISVSKAGDVNGDGVPDLLVGANREDTGGSSAGAAYLLYGPVTGEMSLSSAATIFVGEAANDFAGMSVSSAGDVNGDGLDDVMIGAPQNDASGPNAGAAYIVTGLGL